MLRSGVPTQGQGSGKVFVRERAWRWPAGAPLGSSTSLVGGANAAITALQHPENCCVMHAEEFGDGPGAIACLKPLAGLPLLVSCQLGLAAELDALGSGNPS